MKKNKLLKSKKNKVSQLSNLKKKNIQVGETDFRGCEIIAVNKLDLGFEKYTVVYSIDDLEIDSFKIDFWKNNNESYEYNVMVVTLNHKHPFFKKYFDSSNETKEMALDILSSLAISTNMIMTGSFDSMNEMEHKAEAIKRLYYLTSLPLAFI